MIDYELCAVLKDCGISNDVAGLIDDYVFQMNMVKKRGLLLSELSGTECFRMYNDINTYGDFMSGVYEGVRWTMWRVVYHWCVEVFLELDDDEFEEVEVLIHAGYITIHSPVYFGWDCAHIGDFPVDGRGTYKTFNYNMSVVHSAVEYIQQRRGMIDEYSQ